MARKSKLLIIFLLIALGFYFFSSYLPLNKISSLAIFSTHQSIDSLKIANWNMQIFGEKKAENQTLLENYAKKIANYDLFFIQEIRDDSGTAFPALCSLLPDYTCINSSRAGRTSSKEQYGIIYRKNISLLEVKDFNPDRQDRWERPPVETTFQLSNYNLTLFNIHTKPEAVSQELSTLTEIANQDENQIILGDLNADCSYYDNRKETQFDSWSWLIQDIQDTTSGSSDCAYDRIIVSPKLKDKIVSSGIDSNVSSDLSDHYIVWFEIKK